MSEKKKKKKLGLGEKKKRKVLVWKSGSSCPAGLRATAMQRGTRESLTPPPHEGPARYAEPTFSPSGFPVKTNITHF